MTHHIITSSRIVCGNCGSQLKPDPVREEGSCRPLELMVEDDDLIRNRQYLAAISGVDYRHSVAIAANKPVALGEMGWRGKQ